MLKSKFDPQKHHRRSIRLKGFDYSSEAAYYVTVVTYHRDRLFGEVVNEEMVLNDFGKIADNCWRAIPEHFPLVELGAYVIMPNHVHGIIVITNDRRGDAYVAPTQTTTTRSRASFIRCNCGIIQIRRHPPHRAGTQRHRHVATQLLRAYHPRRKGMAKQNRLHQQ